MKKIIKIVSLVLVFAVITAVLAEFNFSDPPGTSKDADGDLSDGNIVKTDYSTFAVNSALIGTGSVSVSARSCILCTSDGMVIYEKQADVPLPMASITKVMSVIVALEKIEDLKDTVVVSPLAVGIEGSSVYLREGERVDFETLLYSAMLESANDATTALAIAVSRTEEAFVAEMNRKADELGMSNTEFQNPHGLSEDGHYTTARDYARLMAYALENDTFRQIISTRKKVVAADDGSFTRVLTNHNRLLITYKGMLGGKTGYTRASGRTLVTAAQRNETTLICVTIDASNDWNDHTSLYDLGFQTVRTEVLTPENCGTELPVAAGSKESVTLTIKEDFPITIPINSEVTVDYVQPHMRFAPVKKGESFGYAVYYIDGKKAGEIPLYADEDILGAEPEIKSGIIDKIKGFFRKEGN